MSLNIIPREDNQSEVGEINKNLFENNKFTDTVDRKEISWMLNLILNVKSQEEIAQDITNGIFQMVEIENMFPWNYVQELRTGNYESTQNYLNRFKHMSGERIKGVLNSLLQQNRPINLITEIGTCVISYSSVSLINKVKNFMINRKNMNTQLRRELELRNNLGTKKKRGSKKKVNANSNKKDENTMKAPESKRKIRNTKGTKNKLGGNVDDENNIEEIAPLEETTSNDFLSLWTPYHDQYTESSFNDQEKNDDRSTEARPIINKNPAQKKMKIGTWKNPEPKKSKLPIKSSSSKFQNKMVEPKKSKIKKNVTKDKEKESNLTKSNDCREDLVSETRNNLHFEKSLSNVTTNIPNSKNSDKEICSNQNQEIPDVRKDVNESTSKQLDIDNRIVEIKKEPIEFDYYESNYSINQNEEILLIQNSRRSTNSNAVPMNSIIQQSSNNIPERTELVTSGSTSNCKKKKPTELEVAKYIVNNREETSPRKKQEVHERRKKNKLRKYEYKIRNNLEKFKGQVTRLVKDMRYVGVNDEESSDSFSDSSTDYSSDISSTSSYTESSSDALSECSCNCCQSDSFSEEESDQNNDCQYHSKKNYRDRK